MIAVEPGPPICQVCGQRATLFIVPPDEEPFLPAIDDPKRWWCESCWDQAIAEADGRAR